MHMSLLYVNVARYTSREVGGVVGYSSLGGVDADADADVGWCITCNLLGSSSGLESDSEVRRMRRYEKAGYRALELLELSMG